MLWMPVLLSEVVPSAGVCACASIASAEGRLGAGIGWRGWGALAGALGGFCGAFGARVALGRGRSAVGVQAACV